MYVYERGHSGVTDRLTAVVVNKRPHIVLARKERLRLR